MARQCPWLRVVFYGQPLRESFVMVVMIPADLRRLRTVNRLTMVMRNGLLDAICEVGALGAGADLAFCTLSDDRSHRVIGAFGLDVASFPPLPVPEQGARRMLMVADMQADAGLARHPLVDGRLERLGAFAVVLECVPAALSVLTHEGEAVGMIGVGWRRTLAEFPEGVGAVVRRMVPAAETQIQAEAVLTRMAQEAFRLLERVRG